MSELDNYRLPTDFARKDIDERGYKMKNIGNGATIATAEGAVPVSFHYAEVENPIKSKGVKCKIYDEFEIVMWHKSKRMKPTARISELPPELLFIDFDGDISGEWADLYKLFKARKSAKGLDLDKWGELSTGEIATLHSIKVFTLEDFASKSMDALKQRGLPASILEKHDSAIQLVNAREGKADLKAAAETIVSLERELSAARAKIGELENSEQPKTKKKKAGVQ